MLRLYAAYREDVPVAWVRLERGGRILFVNGLSAASEFVDDHIAATVADDARKALAVKVRAERLAPMVGTHRLKIWTTSSDPRQGVLF